MNSYQIMGYALWTQNKFSLRRTHWIIVVAGTEVVELNFLSGYLLWLRENVCIPYQQLMQAIKYIIVLWYSMTADFKLILMSVLDVKFYLLLSTWH